MSPGRAPELRQALKPVPHIDFLVGDEAFETHPGGPVTLRVPVIEFDGIEIDQVPLTETLRVVEQTLDNAPHSEGIPIAPVETIVIMKLLAGRTQDLADIEPSSAQERTVRRSPPP